MIRDLHWPFAHVSVPRGRSEGSYRPVTRQVVQLDLMSDYTPRSPKLGAIGILEALYIYAFSLKLH